MVTITFEVHLITPTSPRNTLATIFKSILILFAFEFLCIFFLLSLSCMGIYKERRKYPIMLSFKHHNFAMPKHTDVIHDCWVLVVSWLFMPFSYDFLVLPVKKSDMSVKYKRLLNLTHHKHKPQNSLA